MIYTFIIIIIILIIIIIIHYMIMIMIINNIIIINKKQHLDTLRSELTSKRNSSENNNFTINYLVEHVRKQHINKLNWISQLAVQRIDHLTYFRGFSSPCASGASGVSVYFWSSPIFSVLCGLICWHYSINQHFMMITFVKQIWNIMFILYTYPFPSDCSSSSYGWTKEQIGLTEEQSYILLI